MRKTYDYPIETFAQYSSMYFRYTDMMKSLFTKQLDVTNMNLFWQASVYTVLYIQTGNL